MPTETPPELEPHRARFGAPVDAAVAKVAIVQVCPSRNSAELEQGAITAKLSADARQYMANPCITELVWDFH
jgi:hypothetical protein